MKKTGFFGPILLILLSSAIISMTMVRSGLLYDFGIGFWGPNGHDAIWHLSLINQLKQNIPPLNPVFSSSILKNYHWGFNLLTAIISKITSINPSTLYFQILPIIFALLLGTLSFYLAYKLTRSHRQALIFTFLNYFAGSFGFLYTLATTSSIGGESLFWSMQSSSILLNPPYALSILILLLGFILYFNQKINYKKAFFIGFFFSLLTLTKIYAAIIFGGTLATYIVIQYLTTKKIIKTDLVLLLSFSSFFLLFGYSLGVFSSQSLIVFHPLWFAHTMIESTDKFYLPRLASYRFNLSQNLNLIKLPVFFFIEFVLTLIFIVGNTGIRLFGLSEIVRHLKSNKVITKSTLFLLLFLTLSLLFPLLFIQKGTPWNTIQFFYYFLLILNFFTAAYLSKLFEKSKVLVVIILLLSSTTSFSSLKDYFGFPPPSAIPTSEVKALSFLSTQKPGIILTFPFDKYKKNELKLPTPLPLYLYETTAYVSAFTQMPTFIDDEMNLDITGFNWQDRKNQVTNFYQSTDPITSRGLLINNDISYIYLVNHQNLSLSTIQLGLDLIYNQDNVRIYRVQR